MAWGFLRRWRVDGCVSTLVLHESPHMRARAAEDLGSMGAREAVDALVGVAVGDSDLRVREAAVRALDQIDKQAAEGRPSVPALIKLLRHSDSSHRASAAQLLARSADPRALEPLVRAACMEAYGAAHGHDPAWALEALKKLDARWGECPAARAAIPELIMLLVLGEAAEQSAARTLLQELDPNWRTSAEARPDRHEVVMCLAKPAACRDALRVLDEIEPGWKTQATGERAATVLRKAMEDKDPEVRKAAAEVLAELGRP